MIIAKTKDGHYLTNHGFKIPSKEYYLEVKNNTEEITEPTEKELIELAKQQHAFYRKEQDLFNIENQLKEINDYEKSKDKVIID